MSNFEHEIIEETQYSGWNDDQDSVGAVSLPSSPSGGLQPSPYSSPVSEHVLPRRRVGRPRPSSRLPLPRRLEDFSPSRAPRLPESNLSVPQPVAPAVPQPGAGLGQGKRRSRGWVFTVNNPRELTLPVPNDCVYFVYQLEKGASGTPHFQGYVLFPTPRGFSSLVGLGGQWTRAHFEPARGTPQQCRDYCTKLEGRLAPPFEHGECPVQQPGKRNDWADFMEDVKAGLSKRSLMEKYPRLFGQSSRGALDIFEEFRPKPPPEPLQQLRPWQEELVQLLAQEPDDRTIIWVKDEAGASGKSRLALHLQGLGDCLVIQPAKHANMSCAYTGERLVIVDIPRSSPDALIYKALESFKDGYINGSAMYGRKPDRAKSPHVVVFSNHAPDYNQFSIDRWAYYSVFFSTAYQTWEWTKIDVRDL